MIWPYLAPVFGVLCFLFTFVRGLYPPTAAKNPLFGLAGWMFLVCINLVNLYVNLKQNPWSALGSCFMIACGVSYGIANATRLIRQEWRHPL